MGVGDACGRSHWGLRWSSLWGHDPCEGRADIAMTMAMTITMTMMMMMMMTTTMSMTTSMMRRMRMRWDERKEDDEEVQG